MEGSIAIDIIPMTSIHVTDTKLVVLRQIRRPDFRSQVDTSIFSGLILQSLVVV